MKFINQIKSITFSKPRFKTLALLICFCCMPQLAQAGNMNCGNYVISDSQRSGQFMGEIQSKCGAPHSKYGNTWIYMFPDGSVYRVYFNDSGELQSIRNEKR